MVKNVKKGFISLLLLILVLSLSVFANAEELSGYVVTIPSAINSWENGKAPVTVTATVYSTDEGKNAVRVTIGDCQNDSGNQHNLISADGNVISYDMKAGTKSIITGEYDNEQATAILGVKENGTGEATFILEASTPKTAKKGDYKDIITFSLGEVNDDGKYDILTPLSECTYEAIDDQIYEGTPVTPDAEIKYQGQTLVAGQDYVITYEDNAPTDDSVTWEAKAQVVGKGDFCGNLAIPFTVKRAEYDISFDANGGSGSAETMTKYFGLPITLPAEGFSLEKCVFLGWDTDPAAATPTYTDQYTGNENTTLFATWRRPWAKAVLSTANNFNFLYDSNIYTVGEYYSDNGVNSQISYVVDVPSDLSYAETDNLIEKLPWGSVTTNIRTASFDESFKDFAPSSIAAWFYNTVNMTTLKNPQNLNTSNLTNTSFAFCACGYTSSGLTLDLSSWDMSKVNYTKNMFSFAGLNGMMAANYNCNINMSGWQLTSLPSFNGMFDSFGNRATTITLDMSGWNIPLVQSMDSLFAELGNYASEVHMNMTGWKIPFVASTVHMFKNIGAMTATTVDLSGLDTWNTSSIQDMTEMFYGVGNSKVEAFLLDLSGWNTGNVTSMSGMFIYTGTFAKTYQIIGLNGWDTHSVQSFSNMFKQSGNGGRVTSRITYNIGTLAGWRTGNCTDMSHMFDTAATNAANFDIGDLSGWDVSKVSNFDSMFYGAANQAGGFNIGNIGSWNTVNATNMECMFYGTAQTVNWLLPSGIKLDLSGWNVSNVQKNGYFDYGNANKIIAPQWPDPEEQSLDSLMNTAMTNPLLAAPSSQLLEESALSVMPMVDESIGAEDLILTSQPAASQIAISLNIDISQLPFNEVNVHYGGTSYSYNDGIYALPILNEDEFISITGVPLSGDISTLLFDIVYYDAFGSVTGTQTVYCNDGSELCFYDGYRIIFNIPASVVSAGIGTVQIITVTQSPEIPEQIVESSETPEQTTEDPVIIPDQPAPDESQPEAEQPAVTPDPIQEEPTEQSEVPQGQETVEIAQEEIIQESAPAEVPVESVPAESISEQTSAAE